MKREYSSCRREGAKIIIGATVGIMKWRVKTAGMMMQYGYCAGGKRRVKGGTGGKQLQVDQHTVAEIPTSMQRLINGVGNFTD